MDKSGETIKWVIFYGWQKIVSDTGVRNRGGVLLFDVYNIVSMSQSGACGVGSFCHWVRWSLLKVAGYVACIAESTPCLKKTVQNCFCQNFVKFPPILILFDRKMANRLKLCEVDSFSTSPNSRHHTTVLNANAANYYTTLKVVICNKQNFLTT